MKLRPKKGDRGRQAQQVFMRSARARAAPQSRLAADALILHAADV